MNKKLYTVETAKNQWRGSYDASYNKENQPSPAAQAIINAKTHGGIVFEVEGDSCIQIWPKL